MHDVLLNTQASVLADLHTEFDRINQRHFRGALITPAIEFSARKSYGGYYQPQRHRIVLSWQAYVEHGWDETVNTFRHEVAHIIHQHHEASFWKLAHELGVTRKYAAVPLKPVKRRSRWYTYQCPACGVKLRRQRPMRGNTSCAKCDSRYNPQYKLVLVASEVQ